MKLICEVMALENKIRFLHTADLHLGAAVSSSAAISAERRNEALLTLEKIFDIAKTFVEESSTKDWRSTVGWLFYIWGHSYEYRNEDDWARMEKLCSYLSNRDDVWYATNIEIYDYVEAYRSLCYSVDLERVYNPSSKDIWLMHEGKVVMIPSNKEVKL